jgi:ABC-type Fe3+-siderophore transport system permease subunit
MQGLFRNPLADPGLVGVSAGSSVSARSLSSCSALPYLLR